MGGTTRRNRKVRAKTRRRRKIKPWSGQVDSQALGKDEGKRCPRGFAKSSLTCVHQSSSSLPSLQEVANADQSPIKAYADLNEELERSGQEDWDKGGNTTQRNREAQTQKERKNQNIHPCISCIRGVRRRHHCKLGRKSRAILRLTLISMRTLKGWDVG